MEDERQAGPERSSGVIQTRSTRRHEAVNISDAARKRRNKSVKRKRDEEEEGEEGTEGECIGRTRREGLEEQTPRYDEAGKSRCERASAASHYTRSLPLRFPLPSPSRHSPALPAENVLFRDETRLRDK